MSDHKPILNITEAIRDYESNIKGEMQFLWNGFNIDLSQKEQYEVIGGIFARQITIAIQFMSSTTIWTDDIAPIILRSMADNFINLAWILKSPKDRSQQFILHGLGQEKLVTEHRKNLVKSDGLDPSIDDMVIESENWINGQRYTFMTEINLGAWSGKKTRDMAEDAGCMDFYNYVYQPCSTVAHNMWNHIAKFNLVLSQNPLHKLLRKPYIPEIEPRIYYIDQAAEYVDKCFELFYQKYPQSIDRKSSYRLFIEQIVALANSENDKNRSV